jgi:hypothetical protein
VPRPLQAVAKLLERRPARIDVALGVLVRLGVQVLPAYGAEAGAVWPAEDLLWKSEADCVSRPGSDLEPVVQDVVGAKRVRRRRRGIVELPRLRVDFHLRKAEAAHAGPREAQVQPEVEDRGTGCLRDLHVDRNRLGMGFVALTAEQERIELDIDTLLPDFPGPEPQSAKVDCVHGVSVAPPELTEESLARVVG